MIRRRDILVAGLALLACTGVLRAASGSYVAVSSLPLRISDEAFWQMVTEFSEPNGDFFSDNFLSNENGFQAVIPELKKGLTPGGVYIGVGPEQNFTYLVALRPKMAFIIDIRRQNMLEHLLYKALIELSSDRAEFLSRLFSRTPLTGVGPTSTVEALFSASHSATADRGLFQRNLQAVKTQLVDHHGFTLGNDDLERIEYVYKQFYVHGPGLSYSLVGLLEVFPNYAELMTETDAAGEHHSYLASEENFRIVKELESDNLIIPLVGDFAGPKTVRAVGRYVREHGTTVTAFYTSNVEQYLRLYSAWSQFCSNVTTLPLETTSTFIRMVTRQQSSGRYRLEPELGNMAAEAKGCGSSDGPP